jgi:hypothetical protein
MCLFNIFSSTKEILLFDFRQEKILAELSEKDSHIADLEMDRSSTGASNRANRIERLNTEKLQLHNQLKELVRHTFIIQRI